MAAPTTAGCSAPLSFTSSTHCEAPASSASTSSPVTAAGNSPTGVRTENRPPTSGGMGSNLTSSRSAICFRNPSSGSVVAIMRSWNPKSPKESTRKPRITRKFATVSDVDPGSFCVGDVEDRGERRRIGVLSEVQPRTSPDFAREHVVVGMAQRLVQGHRAEGRAADADVDKIRRARGPELLGCAFRSLSVLTRLRQPHKARRVSEKSVRRLAQTGSYLIQLPALQTTLHLNEVLVVEGDLGHARAPLCRGLSYGNSLEQGIIPGHREPIRSTRLGSNSPLEGRVPGRTYRARLVQPLGTPGSDHPLRPDHRRSGQPGDREAFLEVPYC